jgi:hypothetical protein
VVVDDVLGVREGPDGRRLAALALRDVLGRGLRDVEGLAVGAAEQEAGQADAEEPRLLRVAQGVPAGRLRAVEDRRDVLDLREVDERVEAEQLGGGVGEERGVGHRRDGGAVLEEGDVFAAGAEVVGRADHAVGAAAEGAEAVAVDGVVERGLGDVRGVLEVVLELVLGHRDHLEQDVLAEVGGVDEVLDAAPGCLELLDLLVVEDGADLT